VTAPGVPSNVRPNDPDVGGGVLEAALPYLPFSSFLNLANQNIGYRILGLSPAVAAGVAIAVDEVRLVPFLVTRPTFLDRIAFVTTVLSGAGGLARIGIYRAIQTPPFLPGLLLVDSGAIAVDAGNGGKITNTVLMLQPGWHWAAYTCGVSAPTIRNLASIAGGWAGLEVVAGATTVNVGGGLVLTRAFAALPADLTGTVITGYSAVAVNIPLILGRVNA
jgi:hypothetical protein